MSRRSREGDPGLRQDLIDIHDHDKSGDLNQAEIDAAEVTEAIEGDMAALRELNAMEDEASDMEAARAKVGAIEILNQADEGGEVGEVNIEIPEQTGELTKEQAEALGKELAEKGAEIGEDRPTAVVEEPYDVAGMAKGTTFAGLQAGLAFGTVAKKVAKLAWKPISWALSPFKKLGQLAFNEFKSWDDEGLGIYDRMDVLKPEEKKEDKKDKKEDKKAA